MSKTVNFSEKLEPMAERIGEHAKSALENPETRHLEEREVIKRSIQSIANEISATTAPSPTESAMKTESNLPSYMADDDEGDAAKEVERLIDEAVNNGMEKALRLAKKSSPFVEDAFHDALVDKLMPEFKKRGIIK
ncbi:hypothetical protein A3I34_01040 [Candidatus Jorgensenbacteria bacterium RIFCSPLOWO2_02_FULL_45_12]|uniref:Uncharacterized protein n=2 Tax=Candidatus Joergenseniibacteriota TaxID=1752739 RepID=A0A1F6BNR7_9BACT|nr:MAG: hypothetical protein UX22_C0029G0007 [Candidatus Jorgensenbacteria bacterium GW2011_GWA2_45_9]OGG38197.1 MAG: hypothetical protein A3D55_00500 [Candidatus Jorgensenbacteria bacterium RIFCSPHIGHO2_02_FULL_45_20]OGG42239.1 MAG: hypothetical protein A3I34_01040 [Candidatus Jorgensenbacteria bacterium RIFCSPLOWO2_02_FULL_45_12]